ncbi:MAG TPA: DegV family protein [Dehalococcoidia bacterium]|nr:DegV family protein [Dehalococcoidia bacterium]
MNHVAVITDSTACIPPDVARAYGIDIIPLNLVFEGRTYVDGMDDDTAEFYRLLRSSRSLPTTAAPSPGEYLRAIRERAKTSSAVLCVTVSAQFSAMYDSAMAAARLAREELPGLDVRVLDSRNAAMAQGFVVLEAARAAREGADIDACIARAEALMPKVALLVVLDTLEYLARGGRVPRVAAWASHVLQVKPIVQFKERDIRLVARTRTKARALQRLAELLAERTAGGGRLHVCVHHANAPDDAAFLAERAKALDPVELYVSEFTQVMGVHTGPGLVGYAFYTE